MKRYIPKTGARITKAQAQFIGEIAEKNGGVTSEDAPAALVSASRDPSAPTHSLFNGTMRSKAAKWDMHRARQLIGCVVLVVQRDKSGEPTHTVRAFQNLRATETEGGGYFPSDIAAKTPRLRERALDELERRLKTARACVGEFKDLVEIVDAAIEATRRVRSKRKGAA